MLPISSSSIFVNKNLFNMTGQRSPLTVTASPCSFSKQNGRIMLLGQNPHQTMTRFGCVRFLMYACEFSVAQMRQFCLFTYQDQNKLYLKRWFFLSKSASSVGRSQAHLAKRIHKHIRFGGRIKLIICQIRHELSVTIHEISSSWIKKR